MQPLAGTEGRDLLIGRMSAGPDASRLQQPVNSEAFWSRRAEDIGVEDVFFHEYFNRLGKDKKSPKEDQKKVKKKARRGDSDSEGEVELGSGNESEIWQALVDSRPELEGDEGSDLDLDMDGLESAYEDDSDLDEAEELSDGGVILNDESDERPEEPDTDTNVNEEPEEISRAEKEKGFSRDSQGVDVEDEYEHDSFDIDVSDDEAFRDSDDDLPSDLEIDFGSSANNTAAKQVDRKKRQKLKHLPIFASVDDYAALLANEDDGT